LLNPLRCRVDCGCVGDIKWQHQGAPAVGFNLSPRRFEAVAAARDQRNVRSALRKKPHRRTSNAG
jgi:hypothetical protein